ncbi:unnamed protein product [Parajaminaea phylloscopi]
MPRAPARRDTATEGEGDTQPTPSTSDTAPAGPTVQAKGPTRPQGNILTSINYGELIQLYKADFPDSPHAEIMEMAKVQLEINSTREDNVRPPSPTPPRRKEFTRDVLKQFESMPKLNRENWHSWLNDFTATIEAIDDAYELIFGEAGPGHPSYDESLDHRLKGLLRAVCDRTSTKNVRWILDKKKHWSGGRELFIELRDTLTKQDGIVRGGLYMELSQVQLPADNDIEKVVHQMQEIRTRASLVGADITDSNLVTHITKLTFHHSIYRTIWESLIVQGKADDWEHVKIAMLTKWRFSQLSPFSRQPRPVARSMETRGAAQVGGTKATNEETPVIADEEIHPSVNVALNGKNAHLWKEAIRKEIEGLEANDTWETVDLPDGEPTIDSKLVLRIKLTPEGKPLKCKARLVARGFTQREGIDYDQTFSPVAPYAAIRAVMAIAASRRWHMHTTDFTQAYLNGHIDKAIYMRPPKGLSVAPGKVFRILKGLYGLKQSGRLWHKELDALLTGIGLVALESAPCIYMGTVGTGKPVIVCTYVDDCLFVSVVRPQPREP